MVAICTLATSNVIQDLKVFLFTLDLFNSIKPTVYLLCDQEVADSALTMYSGQINIIASLDKYKNGKELSRKILTAQKGIQYKTMWEDFMMEKATIMEIALKTEQSVFFFDSDICFMGQLPDIPPNTHLALSQHMIKKIDEERYGKFNAGFLWTDDKRVPSEWRKAAKTSRFYDQAALEEIVALFEPESVHFFSIQNNYGWWRMYQSTESSSEIQKKWSIFRNEPILTSGIRVNQSPLLSIHTHWSETNDRITVHFNLWVIGFLLRLGKHQTAQTLYNFLTKTFTHLRIQ
jgi:hypothetical protein